jgi:hypothetical protein
MNGLATGGGTVHDAHSWVVWVRLRIRRANFLPCGHSSRCTLTDTALIARTRAMVQGWWLMSAAAPAIGRWAKRSLARLKGFEAADLDKMV